MSNKEEIALAGYVALRVDGWELWTACPAWVESADRKCGRELGAGELLCKRHRNVALKRQEKAIEKERERREKRAAERAEMLPKWREELATIEAEIHRRELPITDRAAVGGATHPAIVRTQLRHLSDTNVKCMHKLWSRWDELKTMIGGPQ